MPLEHEGHTIPPGTYTKLFCVTEATMHTIGECVMIDTPDELQKHLQFALLARGRVLITGLGLGCVLRGVLMNPMVEHVTVLERSPHVIKLVLPHIPEGSRWKLLYADAPTWIKEHATDHEFDCAWHDLWSDPDAGERHLAVIHSGMLADLAGHVPVQGAWAFPRDQRRLWRRHGVI